MNSQKEQLHYHIDPKPLKSGGYGSIHLGKFGDIPAAFKQSRSLHQDEFRKEVQLVKKLDDLFVVRFLGTVKTHSNEFMVTELCEGNLSEYVTDQLANIRKGVIDDQVMLGQLIVGLSYLHEEGIIHKDLKPENILLWRGASGLVLAKLADFGFSRQLVEEKKSFDDTNHLGTSGYMAPELLQKDESGKAKPTFESDVWALGVVFYFVVSDGRHPFGDRMVNDHVDYDFRDYLISSLKTARATNPESTRTNHNGVLDLVFHMIDYKPENRPSVLLILYHPYFALSNTTASRYWRGKILVHLSRTAAHNLELAIKRFYDTTTLNEWYDQLGESAKSGIPRDELETVTELMSAIPDYEENLNPDGWQAADQLRKREQMDNEFGKIDNILLQFADVVVNDNATIFDQMLSAAPNLTVTFTYYALCSSKMDDFHQFLRVSPLELGLLHFPVEQFEQLLAIYTTRFHHSVEINRVLHLAITCELPGCVKALVEQGKAQLGSSTDIGDTPLHFAACWNKSLNVIKLLVEYGADPFARRTVDGRTPLHMSAYNNKNMQITTYLATLVKNADQVDNEGMTPLHVCAMNNKNVEVIRALLDAKANVNATDKYGATPLYYAATSGNPDVVDLLLTAGADCTITACQGLSVIHAAAQNPNPEVAKMLLKCVESGTRSKEGDTPLHVCAQVNRNVDVARVFIEAGVDPAAVTDDGTTALHLAMKTGNLEVLQLLLTATSSNGTNPLHYAAANVRDVKVLELLLGAGYTINARNDKQSTPLHLAALQNPNPQVIRFLVDNGADIHAKAYDGSTAIHLAAERNENVKVVQVLLQVGCDPRSRDDRGRSAFHRAMSNKNTDVLSVLFAAIGMKTNLREFLVQ